MSEEMAVYRASHLAAFDGLRRIWCGPARMEGKVAEPNDGCRRSVWVPLGSKQTYCAECLVNREVRSA